MRLAAKSLLLALCCAALPALGGDLPAVPLLRYGVIADSVGSANIVPADITGDGRPEIISCSNGAPFALEHSEGEYPQLWYGPSVGCHGVAAGDANGDGATDVIVAGFEGLFVFDPRGVGAARASVALPEAGYDVAFGNVDLDSAPEIVVTAASAAYVYDAATLELQWAADGYGGNAVFIADIDGNTRNEIVTSGGSILDAGTEQFKWGYAGGFPQLAVGNVDADAKAEIVFTSSWSTTVTVLNGDMTTSTVTGFDTIEQLAVADANGDGTNEIIAGNNQWGDVSGRRATDSSLVWSIRNPEHGCMGIAVADVDGDGAREVLFAGGWTSSGEDALFVGNPLTQTVEWSSLDLDGALSVAAGDVDGDGRTELVIVSSDSGSGYDGAFIIVVDGLSGVEVRRIPVGYYDASSVVIAQLDADPAKEIAVGMWGAITVFDGVTGDREWTSPGYMLRMVIANVDADPTDEIIALYDGKLVVLHGMSNVVQGSRVFDGFAFAAGDVTGDGTAEIIAATSSTLYVLSSSLATQDETDLGGVLAVTTTAEEGGRIAVLTYGGLISLYDASLTPRETCPVQLSGYNDGAIAFGNVAGELRLVAGDGAGIVRTLSVASDTCSVVDSRDIGLAVRNLAVADVTGDGRSELIIGSANAAEIVHIGSSEEMRGDVDGDAVIAANDIDQLVDFLFGAAPGLSTSGDANADERFSGEDAFALIHHEFGGGTLPE